MLHTFKPAAWMAIALIAFTGAASIAWQEAPAAHNNRSLQDTFPKKENAKEDETIIDGNLDKALEDVKRAQENLSRQIQGKEWEKMQRNLQKAQAELDSKNIHLEVENAIKNIDLQKIQMEAQIKNLDLQKIQLEAQTALQKVDWQKMQNDMQKAQAELKNSFDSKKMEIDVQRSMEETKKAMAELKAVDMEKIQQQLEKTKEELRSNEGRMQEDIERAKKEIDENMHKDFRKELEKAQEGVNRAKAELQNYKDMLEEMDKDGLIKSKEQYSIEYKTGDLFINGVKQPENITGKYKHYFKKEHVTLIMKKDAEGTKTIHL